jgi:hypothetical protein
MSANRVTGLNVADAVRRPLAQFPAEALMRLASIHLMARRFYKTVK